MVVLRQKYVKNDNVSTILIQIAVSCGYETAFLYRVKVFCGGFDIFSEVFRAVKQMYLCVKTAERHNPVVNNRVANEKYQKQQIICMKKQDLRVEKR